MDTASLNLDRKMVFPFYIFLTLLMGYMGVASVLSVWEAGETIVIVSLVVLFLLHISLYWLNVLWVTHNERWLLFYYPLQTAAMVGIVLLLNGRSTAGLAFLFSATISIVGEGLGVWGNTRRAFFVGLFYVAMLLGFLYLFSTRETFFGSLTGLLVNGGSIILMMMMFNQLFVQRQKAIDLAESLESANAKLAASAAKIESLTLQNERQRMARELHDTLAQGVAGLVLQLEAVKAHLASNRSERAAEIVEQSITRARSTLAESRAAIDNLRAEPVNVADVVREKVETFKQSTGVACELELSVTENQLDPETLDHAMHILSESLTNISRHAQASNVKVVFAIQNQNLQLEIRDNGKGFDVKQEIKGHYGLVGMHERARLTGGMLAIESDASGTCVQFVVGRS
ncbi:MAG: sensor histidine kinase [Anaerolineales bacterium]|jgi:NarL family two-component system sensor histidine kinase YdfH|nr:sensor histidine kinase [Anaerolineales bacterium]